MLILHDGLVDEHANILKQVWKASIPSNVTAFSWSLLQDRIQTKENLSKRRIELADNDDSCSFCAQTVESTQHLLFNCKLSSAAWNYYFKWLGIVGVQHQEPTNHFIQHNFQGVDSISNKRWKVIWHAVVWSLWCLGTPLFLRINLWTRKRHSRW